MDKVKLFFDAASDLAKQLIAVSTGIIGLSITFLKEVVKMSPTAGTWALTWSWFIFLFSIVCGFWTLMALTGSVWRLTAESNTDLPVNFTSARLPASLQIIFFIGATTLLVIYGVNALRELKREKKAKENPSATRPQPPD